MFDVVPPQNIKPGLKILLRNIEPPPPIQYWTPLQVQYIMAAIYWPPPFDFHLLLNPLLFPIQTGEGVQNYYGHDLFNISGFRISHDLLNPGQFFAVSKHYMALVSTVLCKYWNAKNNIINEVLQIILLQIQNAFFLQGLW